MCCAGPVRSAALLECVELMCVFYCLLVLWRSQRASIIVRNGGKPLRVSLRGCGNLLQIHSSSGFWTLPTPASLVLRGQNPLLSDRATRLAGFMGILPTATAGARNQLWAAMGDKSGGRLRSGEYYEPVGVAGRASEDACDDALADALWEWTEHELDVFLGSL